MASKKTKVVDGYTAIRAAQEAARHGRGDPLRPEKETSAQKTTEPSKAGSRIGRSVMPTKREIICPACGAVSSVVGKVDLWVCTQCRHRMRLQDLKIPEGEWKEEIEVGGTVTVLPGAKLTGGKITANDIVLQGKMEGVEIRACHKLTITAEAQPDWVRLKMLDLEVGTGASLTPGKPIEARNLSLHGKFSGNATLAGTLTIFADGDFSGQLKSAGLQVEEGGGFRAMLDVKPENAPPPPAPKPKAPAKANPRLRPPPGNSPQRPAAAKVSPVKAAGPTTASPPPAAQKPATKKAATKKSPAKKADTKKSVQKKAVEKNPPDQEKK